MVSNQYVLSFHCANYCAAIFLFSLLFLFFALSSPFTKMVSCVLGCVNVAVLVYHITYVHLKNSQCSPSQENKAESDVEYHAGKEREEEYARDVE